jgi:hypothetical protein
MLFWTVALSRACAERVHTNVPAPPLLSDLQDVWQFICLVLQTPQCEPDSKYRGLHLNLHKISRNDFADNKIDLEPWEGNTAINTFFIQCGKITQNYI